MKQEILAPAGSLESLKSAVHNGADAVYLGLDKFNARMKAENFSLENLRQHVDFCHLYGVKVYVTLNTSVKQNEYFDACQMLCDIYNNNCDGVILTDLSLIEFCAKNFTKPFEIVASTQLNIHDVYGAKYVEKLGATTVVLARETPYESIVEICKNTNLRVECFVHGAICVSQSGQCLFSSMVGGNSGNRGLCAQPCRQFYKCFFNNKQVNEGYLLSAKDMCGLTFAKKLSEAGVVSFKIEGRNRRSQYAGLTSRIYRQLFDNSSTSFKDDIDALSRIYNRGNYIAEQYLSSHKEGIVYPKTQGHIGLEIGKIQHRLLDVSEPVQKGDEFKILRNGFEVGSARALEDGIQVKASYSGSVKDGDSVCITSDYSQLAEIDSFRKKLPVRFELQAKVGQQPKLTCLYGDISVTCTSDFVCEKAIKQATSVSELTEQLQKTAETCYTISDIVFHVDEIFLPKSIINALRRETLQCMQSEIVEQYNKKLNRTQIDFCADSVKIDDIVSNATPKLAVVCRDVEQFKLAISDQRLHFVIAKLPKINAISLKQLCAISNGKIFYTDIPSFADLNYLQKTLENFKGVGIVAHNVGAVEFAQQNAIEYIAGSGLNIYNSYIAKTLTPNGQSYVVSTELTLNEADQMLSKNGLQFVDGKIVLMKLVHCPYQLNFNASCSKCNFQRFEYVDKLQNRFEIERVQCPTCTFELINGKKLSVVSRLKKSGSYLVDFDKNVIEHYLLLNNGIDDFYVEQSPYTKGRLIEKVN